MCCAARTRQWSRRDQTGHPDISVKWCKREEKTHFVEIVTDFLHYFELKLPLPDMSALPSIRCET